MTGDKLQIQIQIDISKLKVKHLVELEKTQRGELPFERMVEILNTVTDNVDVYELNLEELREVVAAIDAAVEASTNPETPEGN